MTYKAWSRSKSARSFSHNRRSICAADEAQPRLSRFVVAIHRGRCPAAPYTASRKPSLGQHNPASVAELQLQLEANLKGSRFCPVWWAVVYRTANFRLGVQPVGGGCLRRDAPDWSPSIALSRLKLGLCHS